MPTALLVSHGQPSDPDAGETEIRALAAEVARHTRVPTHGVTLAAKGRLEDLLDQTPGALIYPMFMTDGWFTSVQLPRRIGARSARMMAPFGTDPDLPAAVAGHLTGICDGQGWDVPSVTVAVLAHGSGRSPMAALDTAIFTDRLRRHLPAAFRIGFVEQRPYLTEALAGLGPRSIALPFFAARRGHVTDDLPEAASKMNFSGHMLDPVGLLGIVPEMIAHRLSKAAHHDDPDGAARHI